MTPQWKGPDTERGQALDRANRYHPKSNHHRCNSAHETFPAIFLLLHTTLEVYHVVSVGLFHRLCRFATLWNPAKIYGPGYTTPQCNSGLHVHPKCTCPWISVGPHSANTLRDWPTGHRDLHTSMYLAKAPQSASVVLPFPFRASRGGRYCARLAESGAPGCCGSGFLGNR